MPPKLINFNLLTVEKIYSVEKTDILFPLHIINLIIIIFKPKMTILDTQCLKNNFLNFKK